MNVLNYPINVPAYYATKIYNMNKYNLSFFFIKLNFEHRSNMYTILNHMYYEHVQYFFTGIFLFLCVI